MAQHGRWNYRILGVRPDAQTRGVGLALKFHQRAWAVRGPRVLSNGHTTHFSAN